MKVVHKFAVVTLALFALGQAQLANALGPAAQNGTLLGTSERVNSKTPAKAASEPLSGQDLVNTRNSNIKRPGVVAEGNGAVQDVSTTRGTAKEGAASVEPGKAAINTSRSNIKRPGVVAEGKGALQEASTTNGTAKGTHFPPELIK